MSDKPSIDAIFCAAIEIESSDQRQSYLNRACGEDAELRRQIDRLLQAHFRGGSIVDSPAHAISPTIEKPPLERLGTQIGPYKLLQVIGEGGMGTVYMAEQTEPVERKVALKVIKAGMDTHQVIARFEAERQALAMMDHVNIARVLDVGTTQSGRPYFVMELVHGIPITKYCDDNHLTPRQRLELFVPVCQAIQHAHQKGIIHRDIKPSNVMVTLYDGQPVPKVIDFGVAKATELKLTERTLFTQFGMMIGTLEYMSPEQAEMSALGVDTRSDIFSLGVLLYELLTGSTPLSHRRLKEAAYGEILRMIREEEAPKPSTRLSDSGEALASISAQRHMEPAKLTKLVRGELDWIVMKTLEKDRNRRYATANGFAADVQRYLNDEPVQACPPSATYLFRKFARRNQTALATTSVVAAALVLGMFVSAWQAIRATKAEKLAQTWLQAEQHARRDAELARDGEAKQRRLAQEKAEEAKSQRQKALDNFNAAEIQRQQAEANFAQARKAVDDYFVQISESELLQVPGMQPLRRELLHSALEFYEEFVKVRGNDPRLKEELAHTLVKVGRIHAQLESKDEARAAYNMALKLYRELLKDHSEPVKLKAGETTCLQSLGKIADAIEGWKSLLRLDPVNNMYRSELAQAYNSLAQSQSNANKLSDALASYQQARELCILLVSEEPTNPAYNCDLGQTLNNIGTILSKQGRREDALALYREAARYGETARNQAPAVLKYGSFLTNQLANIGGVEQALGRNAKALQAYEQRAEVSRSLAIRNPAVPSLQKGMFDAFRYLAAIQRKLKQPEKAARSLRQAREVMERLPRETADDWYIYAQVMALCAAPRSPDDEILAEDPRDQAARQRDADEAVAALRAAIEKGFNSRLSLTVNGDPSFAALRDRDDFRALADQLAEVARLTGIERQANNPAKLSAAANVAAALAKLSAADPQNAVLLASSARSQHAVGLVRLGLGQLAEAEASLDEALRIREQLRDRQAGDSQGVLDVIETRVALGEVYEKSARLPQAHAAWQQGLAVVQDLPHDSKLAARVATLERDICIRYGTLGIWPLAVVHAQRNAQLKRSADPLWEVRFAMLLAVTGGEEALRAYCRSCYEQSSGAGGTGWSQSDLMHLAWLSSLLGPPALPAEQLEQWTQPYESSRNSWGGLCLALARHRAGKHAAALAILDSYHTDADYESLGNYAPKLSAAYLCALAAKGAGQDQRAQQQLQRAEGLFQQACRSCLSGDEAGLAEPMRNIWWELAAAQILRREAWQAITGQPVADEQAWLHLICARGYRALGEPQKMDEELAAAAPDDSSNSQILRARADLRQSWGDIAGAEADWRRIVAAAGEDPAPWVHCGRFYAALGKPEQAAACFAEAIAPTAGKRPSLAAIPFSADEAARQQRAWADHLGVPVEFENSLGMKFRLVPPGTFDMGIMPDERRRIVGELKRQGKEDFLVRYHEEEGFVRVFLTAPYYLAQCEVTVQQFRKFVEDTGYQTDGEKKGMGGFATRNGKWVRDPSHIWKSPEEGWDPQDDQPVVQVSWNDAVACCNWLSKKENKLYTLPSEAQWEFACRGGSPTLFGAGDDPAVLADIAWTNETRKTAGVRFASPVGTKKANPFGLHDMLGNAFEWCADFYAPGSTSSIPLVDPLNSNVAGRRVDRGGAWFLGGYWNRCGLRVGVAPDNPGDLGKGFRIAIMGDLKRAASATAVPEQSTPAP